MGGSRTNMAKQITKVVQNHVHLTIYDCFLTCLLRKSARWLAEKQVCVIKMYTLMEANIFVDVYTSSSSYAFPHSCQYFIQEQSSQFMVTWQQESPTAHMKHDRSIRNVVAQTGIKIIMNKIKIK